MISIKSPADIRCRQPPNNNRIQGFLQTPLTVTLAVWHEPDCGGDILMSTMEILESFVQELMLRLMCSADLLDEQLTKIEVYMLVEQHTEHLQHWINFACAV